MVVHLYKGKWECLTSVGNGKIILYSKEESIEVAGFESGRVHALGYKNYIAISNEKGTFLYKIHKSRPEIKLVSTYELKARHVKMYKKTLYFYIVGEEEYMRYMINIKTKESSTTYHPVPKNYSLVRIVDASRNRVVLQDNGLIGNGAAGERRKPSFIVSNPYRKIEGQYESIAGKSSVTYVDEGTFYVYDFESNSIKKIYTPKDEERVFCGFEDNIYFVYDGHVLKVYSFNDKLLQELARDNCVNFGFDGVRLISFCSDEIFIDDYSIAQDINELVKAHNLLASREAQIVIEILISNMKNDLFERKKRK